MANARKHGKWSGQKRRRRLQIPVDEDMHDLLEDLSAVTGRSVPSLCEELLTQSAPAIQKMITALNRFDVQPGKSLWEMAELMYQASSAAKQLGFDLHGEALKKGIEEDD